MQKRKNRERERLRQRQGETRLGLLTQLGRSMVRDHPGVKFSPFFFLTSLVSDWYSPYLGCIPGISKLYRNKNNDFFSLRLILFGMVVSVSHPYSSLIHIEYRYNDIFAIAVHQRWGCSKLPITIFLSHRQEEFWVV